MGRHVDSCHPVSTHSRRKRPHRVQTSSSDDEPQSLEQPNSEIFVGEAQDPPARTQCGLLRFLSCASRGNCRSSSLPAAHQILSTHQTRSTLRKCNSQPQDAEPSRKVPHGSIGPCNLVCRSESARVVSQCNGGLCSMLSKLEVHSPPGRRLLQAKSETLVEELSMEVAHPEQISGLCGLLAKLEATPELPRFRKLDQHRQGSPATPRRKLLDLFNAAEFETPTPKLRTGAGMTIQEWEHWRLPDSCLGPSSGPAKATHTGCRCPVGLPEVNSMSSMCSMPPESSATQGLLRRRKSEPSLAATCQRRPKETSVNALQRLADQDDGYQSNEGPAEDTGLREHFARCRHQLTQQLFGRLGPMQKRPLWATNWLPPALEGIPSQDAPGPRHLKRKRSEEEQDAACNMGPEYVLGQNCLQGLPDTALLRIATRIEQRFF